MAHGENGTPVAPEWFIDPALERCIGCNEIKVSCEAQAHFGAICCGVCSHLIETRLKMPASWDGDQN